MRSVALVVALLMVFSGGYLLGQKGVTITRAEQGIQFVNRDSNQPKGVDFSLFWSVYNTLNEKHAGNLSNQDLLYGAINGLVAGTGDPFTNFFKPVDSTAFQSELNGSFEGIGAELAMQNGLITVVTPLVDSPASKAGIVSGDRIIQINGKDAPSDINAAINLIRGPKSTTVTLKIVHGDKNQMKDVPIVRDTIQIKSVTWSVKGTTGVIVLNQFTGNTVDLFDQALVDLQSKNVTGYVIDMRDDPGGLLDAAVSVASRLMPAGTVVTEKGKDGSSQAEMTNHDQVVKGKPIIVLLNKGSASAAEILAGALQDAGVAKVVGETSYGKGSVQEVVPFSDGSSLKVTIAHWFTPKGRGIDKIGIKPDVAVIMTDEDRAAKRDPQMDKALQLAK